MTPIKKAETKSKNQPLKNEEFQKFIDKTCNEIISDIEKQNLIPIIGHNATGKTQVLNKIYDSLSNDDNWNVLYIRSETIFNEEIKKSAKANDDKYSSNIKQFINKLFGSLQISFNNEIKEKINKANDFITKFHKEIDDNSNNKYFKKEIKKIIKSKYDQTKESFNEEFFDNNDVAKEENLKNSSTGEGVFSIISFCLYFIKTLKKEKFLDNNKKNLIIIDEPEKFCHPSLVSKISRIISELSSMEIKIIFTTHSPELIFQICRNNKVQINSSLNAYKMLDNYFYDKVKIDYGIKNSSRDIKILVNSFFDENIFLVEGLKDYELISTIIDNSFSNYYYSVYDCSGKENVKKMAELILTSHISITSHTSIKLFLLFDKDFKPNKAKNSSSRISDMNSMINDISSCNKTHSQVTKFLNNSLKNIVDKSNNNNDINNSKNYLDKIKSLQNNKNVKLFFYELDDNLEDFLGETNTEKNDLTNINLNYLKNLPKYKDLENEIKLFLVNDKLE